ncbi:MAG: 5-(carboxyamino)imidazole ribonucleotide mutase [Gammaproteobacteria bacterium AqS3]|nr:5-(carboxyamino)imidazole ribonucleotide mutase [Gammaproteobacteria bacterium AqS3]
MSEQKWVAFLMGSDSDLPVLEAGFERMDELQVRYEARVLSAHRTPAAVHEYIRDAEARGCTVFVCAAGMAAHLAGAVAAQTTRPVIGIPVDSGPLQGFDALLSTVQMPGGVPVAAVAIGRAGAVNAAFLAAQILAVADADLAERVMRQRQAAAEKVLQKDAALQARS